MKRILTLLLAICVFSLTTVTAFAEGRQAFDETQPTVLVMSLQENPDTFDLRTPSGLTAEELETALRYKLKGMAEYYLAAEEKYNVNAVFLASVSALESGWGRYCFRKNNIFGYGRKSFESYGDCIDFVASKLDKNYLSEDGRYYNGTTIDAVNCCYNGREQWSKSVKSIFAGMLQKISDAKDRLL